MGIDQDPPESPDFDNRYELFEHYKDQLSRVKSRSVVEEFNSAKKRLNQYLDENDLDIGEIGTKEANEILVKLKEDPDIKEVVAKKYALAIRRMFAFYVGMDVLRWNPFQSEYDDSLFDVNQQTKRRKVDLETLKREIKGTKDPLDFVLIFILAKTGIRRGEAYNLDLRDIHIDHPVSEWMPEPRYEISDTPDSMFIDSDISEGDVYNGEKRNSSNKREKKTVVPLDEETKEVIVWWVSILPPSPSSACPFFRSLGDANCAIGKRLEDDILYERVRDWARERGWNPPGISPEKSIYPHWFRHWFTTNLRTRIHPNDLKGKTDDGEQISEPVTRYVEGLRGQVGSEVIDTYTHDWGEKPWIRTAYTENIPKLLTK